MAKAKAKERKATAADTREAPAGFDDVHREAFVELANQCKPTTPGPILEEIATNVVLSRSCQQRISKEGSMVADSRGNPIVHPAVAMQAAAHKRATSLLSRWAVR